MRCLKGTADEKAKKVNKGDGNEKETVGKPFDCHTILFGQLFIRLSRLLASINENGQQ